MTVRRPSKTKIERAKWIALRTNQTIQEGVLADDKALSAWIKLHEPASDNQIKQIKRWIASGKVEAPPRYPHAMTAAEARRVIAANRPARTRGEQRQARRGPPWLVRKLLWFWLLVGIAVPMIVGVFIPLFFAVDGVGVGDEHTERWDRPGSGRSLCSGAANLPRIAR